MTDTQTQKMPIRFGLLFLVVLGLLVWTVSAFSVQDLGPQLDGPEIQVADLNGDTSSPDPHLVPASVLALPAPSCCAFSPQDLRFVRPPVRLLSYPGLAQAPPALV